MQNAPPDVIEHTGLLVFPDVEHTLPIKLLGILAFAWVLLGPIYVFEATRRWKMGPGVVHYTIGTQLAVVALFAIEWGWPNADTFTERYGVLLRHLGGPLYILAAGLGLVAVFTGCFVRRFWPAVGR